MFRYLEKHSWWSTLEEKQVPTIEELLKLCKSGDVGRIIIPNTYYGYGASLIDDSNNRSIQRHYKNSRFKNMQYNLTMSAQQFIRNEHYRELIEELQEKDPIFDSQDHSELESETKLDFIVDEIAYVLINDDSYELFELLPDTLQETKDLVRELLQAGEWNDRIEWWEHVEIDNDGATPYAEKTAIKELTELVKIKWEATK